MEGSQSAVAAIQTLSVVTSLLLLIGGFLAARGYLRGRSGPLGLLAAGLFTLALPGLLTATHNWWALGPGRPVTQESVLFSVYLANGVVLAGLVLRLLGYLLLALAAFSVPTRSFTARPTGIRREAGRE